MSGPWSVRILPLLRRKFDRARAVMAEMSVAEASGGRRQTTRFTLWVRLLTFHSDLLINRLLHTMLGIHRILWPTDFSAGAESAFPYAAALASWHEAELHVLNVASNGSGTVSDTDRSFPLSRDRLADLLAEREEPPQSIDVEEIALTQEQRAGDSPPENMPKSTILMSSS